MNTMQVNAALWNLVNQNNMPESAQIVVAYAMSIPITGNTAITIIRTREEQDGFTGMTEHGNVALREEGVPKEVVTEFGITRARIGHFKLWRYDSHIEFCHYWAADPTTEDTAGDGVETFYLAYNAEEKRATAFGVWVAQLSFSIWLVKCYNTSVKTLWGEQIDARGYRLHIG